MLVRMTAVGFLIQLLLFCLFTIKVYALDCSDPNEITNECPSYCPSDACPTGPKSYKNCPSVQSDQCGPPACKCRFNYSRLKNGTCVPTRECPPFKCTGRHEVYDPCPPFCPTDDCSQATPTGKCPIFGRIGIVVPCTPDCRCRKNFWRKNGTCVPYVQCNRKKRVIINN